VSVFDETNKLYQLLFCYDIATQKNIATTSYKQKY